MDKKDTSSQPTTRIILIRHGQSEANAGGLTANDNVIALTSLGRQQASRFAENFPHIPSRFILSPYLRARQTAEPMLQRFPAVRVEDWPIQEFHYLDLDGSALTDRQRQPHVLSYWERCDPAYVDGPRSESFSAFISRARGTIQRLSTENLSGCHVLFTHGFWMQAFRLSLLFPDATDLELMSNFRRFHFVNQIRNLESLEFEAIGGHIRLLAQEHLNTFTLEGAVSK